MIYVTLYQRLTAHYEATKSKPLDNLQKSHLGRNIAKAWYNSDNQKKDFLEFTKSQEDDGQTYRVLSYPEYFAPEIDKLIQEYYSKLPKKIRKRIPLKSFNAKPSN